jgi:hypothetical protein
LITSALEYWVARSSRAMTMKQLYACGTASHERADVNETRLDTASRAHHFAYVSF